MGTASSHEYIIKFCHFHTKQKCYSSICGLHCQTCVSLCVCVCAHASICLCVNVSMWVCASVQGKLLHTQLCICKVTIVFQVIS